MIKIRITLVPRVFHSIISTTTFDSPPKEKNFILADELRDKIIALEYEVKETRQGTEIKRGI